ncbi:MAG: glycosyltransferase family 2 protein [Anaerolineae bacterium]
MDIADVTVVVPTRNDERTIAQFLASVPPDIEVILVDASEDTTPQVAIAQRPAHTRVLRSHGNITECRQYGAEATRSAWILFSDADVVFSIDYFRRLVRYEDSELLYGPKLATGRHAAYFRWASIGQRLFHALGIPSASGSNLLIQRDAFLRIGGFDLGLNRNEDSELAWRARRKGCRVRYAPDLVVLYRGDRRHSHGAWRRALHSLARCALLYTGLMPDSWRSGRYDYWSPGRSKR